jgi:hypothetical protein
MKPYLYTLPLFCLLSACDCHQAINGIVADNLTRRPIARALVVNKNRLSDSTRTDSNGHFSLSAISGGFVCPDMLLLVAAEGYERGNAAAMSGKQVNILLHPKQGVPVPKGSMDPAAALRSIRNIFDAYKDNEEGIDSDGDKALMTASVNSLGALSNAADLELLINVWNYYDPTDYSCKREVFEVLQRSKPASIQAVKHRMQHRMPWEKKDLSDTDFGRLLEMLEAQ